MDKPFMMGTTSSITMQSLRKIVQGAKMWCLFLFFTGRIAAQRQTAGIFYSQAKNQVFRPAGVTRCTDSGQTLQYRQAPGSAWLCKISHQLVQRVFWWNAAPKISKISTFW